MRTLWALDDEQWATVRQVHESLADRGLAYTTVMTVMDRLARKEYVEQQRDGRAYRYRPRVSRAGLTAELMRETLADMGADERGSALVSFVEDAGRRRHRGPAPRPRRPGLSCRSAVLTPLVLGALALRAGEPRAVGARPLRAAAAHPGAGHAAVAEHRPRRRARRPRRRACRWSRTGCGPATSGRLDVAGRGAGRGSDGRGRRAAAAERPPHRHHPAPAAAPAPRAGRPARPGRPRDPPAGDLGPRPRGAGGLLRARDVAARGSWCRARR